MSAHLTSLVRHLRQAGDRAVADEALLDRYVRRGDEAAFAALVERHGPMVFGVCRRALASAHDAEDAFQATFLVLARRARVVRPGAMVPWLYGVARRVAAKSRRRSARHRPLKPRDDRAAGPRDDPLAGLTARELITALDEEVTRLPEAYRLPVVLCCLEGLSQEEAARRLGWTAGSVRGRLERGRKRLHERLARRGLALAVALGAAEVARGAGPAAPLLRAAASGTVPASAARLAGAVLRPVALTRLGLLGTVLLLVASAGGAGVAGYLSATAPPLNDRAEDARPKAAGQPGPRTDAFGDSLPEGALRRLGTLRFRQGGGYVNRLLVTPDGKTLVSKSYYGERTVAVWDLATGKLLRQLPGHYDENRAATLSPDGKTLATGTDKVITFHDLATGREVRRLASPVGGAEGLAFAPDGKTLASGHGGDVVLLWDLARGEVRARLAAKHNRSGLLAFSPDGKLLATGDTLDPLIRLFDTATGQERHQLKRPSFVHDFAFAPDGTLLAAGAQDGVISLWEPATGKLVRELRSPYKHVRAVAWAPDGKTLAASEYDEKGEVEYIRFWDVAAGKDRRAVAVSEGLVESLAYTPDGKTLVTGGRFSVIRLRDAATGEERSAAGHDGPVWWLALSPDGKTLAYSDRGIRIWDTAAGREVGSLPGHHWSFAFSPDGRTLAGGADVNGVNLWDVAGRRLVRRLEVDAKKERLEWIAYYHVAFSPDGKTLAAFGRGLVNKGQTDAVIHLWDHAAGTIVGRLSLKDRPDEFCTVEGVAFSPDGRVLAASGRAAQGGSKVRLWEVATGKELSPQTTAINSADDRVASEGSEFVEPHIAFSPDGRLLATNRHSKGIPVWEALTGRERCRLDEPDGTTTCVAFAPDGRTLASAGWNGTIRLWDVERAKELKRLTGHRGKVNALVFTPDGATIISGGNDTTVLFWDVAAVTRRGREREPLAADQWEPLWADLAAADAAAAHRAIARLAAAPEATLPTLKERLRPAPAADADQVARLLRDLDAEEFAVRERATRELERLGEAARPALQRERDRPGVGAEVRKRLEGLIAGLAVPSGERLRELRAVEVLERVGDAEARRLLEALARGEPEARLTREARAAADRLARRAGR